MNEKEQKNSLVKGKRLTDEELEKVSGGVTTISKKQVLSEDGVTKADLQSSKLNN